ncbi:hypothetical protein PILCRDRAFT_6401 [Piloderma croceum F 1598]|uniref:Uncharacterized protein n=1 Tax=Piloderma croceum (strain F 1598) TaxID=765440 RepID=A0A0C3G0D6_PILCF|nr:hypothetical protein PILCRDRAFT_6401 [Piloderma croceum F 1598]
MHNNSRNNAVVTSTPQVKLPVPIYRAVHTDDSDLPGANTGIQNFSAHHSIQIPTLESTVTSSDNMKDNTSADISSSVTQV